MIAIIKNLDEINWKNHILIEGDEDEEDETLADCLKTGEISIGDEVIIENDEDHFLDLSKTEYVLTFNKKYEDGSSFYAEDIFTLNECIKMFGEDFSYVKGDIL